MVNRFPPFKTASGMALAFGCALAALAGTTALAAPVPGYVPPVVNTTVPQYADPERGVYVPSHTQHRMKSAAELQNWQQMAEASRPMYAQSNPNAQAWNQSMNMVSHGVTSFEDELNRIAQDPGLIAGGRPSADLYLYENTNPMADQRLAQAAPQGGSWMQQGGAMPDLSAYPSLATGGAAQAWPQAMPPSNMMPPMGMQAMPVAPLPTPMAHGMMPVQPGPQAIPTADGGYEIAVAAPTGGQNLDMQNSIVRLSEQRISVRRAVQRMMDQIGGGTWAVIWDLDEMNAGLPDMEISLYAEEPFVNVLNALLARLQTRSGQPLRVIRYDRTNRLVITDRAAGETRAGIGPDGVNPADLVVTEAVLKDSRVSLHYDEIPLVDALENIIQQAGKGQWRLRMYAGLDQVLKPAHIEEPFHVAMERLLKLFALKYEVFPGGKLIVVTQDNKFGYPGVQR